MNNDNSLFEIVVVRVVNEKVFLLRDLNNRSFLEDTYLEAVQFCENYRAAKKIINGSFLLEITEQDYTTDDFNHEEVRYNILNFGKNVLKKVLN